MDKQFTITNPESYLTTNSTDGKVCEVRWLTNNDGAIHMLVIYREIIDGIRHFKIEEIDIKD